MKGEIPLVFYPRTGSGEGMGHLIRSIRFLKEILSRGRTAFLYIPGSNNKADDTFDDKEEVHKLLRERGLGPECYIDNLGSFPDAILITDLRACSAEEFLQLSSFPFLVGLDEGGEFRSHFPYLIDLIPGEGVLSKANATAAPVSLKEEPLKEGCLKEGPVPPVKELGSIKLLLSFGGEDPEDLSSFVAVLITKAGLISPGDITLLRGPGQSKGTLPPGVREIGPVEDLRPLLKKAELLVTSYGLTAWEAVSLRVPVLLCNPTDYHERLSRINGFVSLGAFPRPRGRRDTAKARRRLYRLFTEPLFPEGPLKLKGKPEMPPFDIEDPVELILGLEFPDPPACPLCGEKGAFLSERVLYRERVRTFKLCPSCACGVQIFPFQNSTSYDKDYFSQEYKSQYGRDYLEDFPHIKQASFPRIERIEHLLGGDKGKKLLDIGCAYGPFLSAALDRGYVVTGIEISASAAEEATKVTGAPVIVGNTLDLLKSDTRFTGENLYDVVSLWYVIEHLPRVDELIQEIQRILKPGGVLAISTPSFLGISGRKDRNSFFRNSPSDHLFVMEPRQATRFFTDRGFSFGDLRFPSLHAERFPPPWNTLPTRILSFLSQLGKLGDTFELYLLHEKKGAKSG